MGDIKLRKQPKEQEKLNDCPICLNGRFLNRLSKDGFFCMSCLNEFKVKNKKTYILEINETNGEASRVLVK
jgi:hypothetical protein